MTGTTRSSDELDARCRKLLFRSWHRGIRETDLILGAFADSEIGGLGDADLDDYEALLEVQDADILLWVTGGEPIPESYDTPVLAKILAFRRAMVF